MSKPKFTIKELLENNTQFITYQLNGKTVIRRSSAPTKERIQSDPAFHSIKMNNQEFAAAAALSKSIRNTHLQKVLGQFKDPYMAARLTGACRKVVQQGQGQLGTREASISAHPKSLIDFPYNKNRPLAFTFSGQVHNTIASTRDYITVQTHIQKNLLKGYPQQATHLQVTVALATVAQHTFNNQEQKYTPAHPAQNALGTYIQCKPIPFREEEPTLKLQLPVPLKETPHPSTALVLSFGITFGDITEDTYNNFKTASAMNIIAVL